MSLAELKQESAAQPIQEQQELAAFLAVLRMKQSGEWDETTAGAGVPDRENWMTLEEAKRRLSQES